MSLHKLLNVIQEHIKHDIYAIGFINDALNSIKTFSDYIHLKPQMLQAVTDITQSLTYLLNLSYEETTNTLTPSKQHSLTITPIKQIDTTHVSNKQTLPEHSHIQNDNPPTSTQSHKDKQRIEHILTKIHSDNILKNIIVQLFGKNIINEMTSSKVSPSHIENINNIVTKIDNINTNTKTTSSIPQKQVLHTKSNNPPSKLTKSDNLLKSKGLLNTHITTTIPNNKKPLRYRNNTTTLSSTLPHQRTFINYTSPHGHYFDASLQRGGASSITSTHRVPHS